MIVKRNPYISENHNYEYHHLGYFLENRNFGQAIFTMLESILEFFFLLFAIFTLKLKYLYVLRYSISDPFRVYQIPYLLENKDLSLSVNSTYWKKYFIYFYFREIEGIKFFNNLSSIHREYVTHDGIYIGFAVNKSRYQCQGDLWRSQKSVNCIIRIKS